MLLQKAMDAESSAMLWGTWVGWQRRNPSGDVQGNVFWLGKSPRRDGACEVVWEIPQHAWLLCSFIAICCWPLSKPARELAGPLVIPCMAFPVFLLLKIYFFH